MTDRYNALTVVLEKDMREDDAQDLLSAIRQLRGVLRVEGNVSDINSHIAYARARGDLSGRLLAALRDD